MGEGTHRVVSLSCWENGREGKEWEELHRKLLEREGTTRRVAEGDAGRFRLAELQGQTRRMKKGGRGEYSQDANSLPLAVCPTKARLADSR